MKPFIKSKRISAERAPLAGGPESGKTVVLEPVFVVNQGVQLVLNAIRRLENGILNAINWHPKEGVDYAFNTPDRPIRPRKPLLGLGRGGDA